MKSKSLLTLFVFFLFLNTVNAQHNQYQFSQLNINQGLSNNQITCIYKDTKGFMWFGTMSGLNRYDGYKFKVFKHNNHAVSSLDDDYISNIQEGPDQSLWIQTRSGFNIYNLQTGQISHDIKKTLAAFSIPDSLISNIKKDRNGNFWFVHNRYGIYRYNPKTKKTRHYTHQLNDSTSLYSNTITAIAEDSGGDFWIAHNNGVLEKLDAKTNKITSRIYTLNKLYPQEHFNMLLSIDAQDDLWVYINGGALGTFYFNPKTKSYKHIDKNSIGGKLNSNIVYNIVQDNKGLVWISTDHGGINLLDKKTFSTAYITNRAGDPKSIAQNSITALYKDNTGIIWVGTYKRGISYYHESIIKFPLYQHHPADLNSLSYDDVNKFAEDAEGNLWIGTNGGGLIYFDRKKNTYQLYKHQANNAGSLCNDVIVSLCIDHEQKLWIGTYFGGLDCFDGKTFKHYKHNEADPNSISDDRVWEIMEDSQNRLWVGTLAGGLNLFDRQKKIFYHYQPKQPNSIHSTYISALIEDQQGNIWIGTSDGIDVLEKKSNHFIHYLHNEKNTQSLINNNIVGIYSDSRNLIWITTQEGLSIFNPQTKTFRNFFKEDGLPDNATLEVLEDNHHHIWLSTKNGLSDITVSGSNSNYKLAFKNYDEADGLQGREFNENAALKTRKGELVFGGASGFNLFVPEQIKANTNKPAVFLTDFQIFDQSIQTGEKVNGDIILSKSITDTKAVTLSYQDNVFSIEFAALNFFDPQKVKLQYKLEGFNKSWVTADNYLRKATYTNLDPGTYTFKVKAVNADGVWSDKEANLKITVLPPLWRTWYAFFTYVILVLGGLYLMRRRGIQKIKTQFALEQERKEARITLEYERQEAKRMHDLDLMKIKFFTNVSHEFRTPLSLILSPIEDLIKKTAENDQHLLLTIKRNGKRLLNLVNQLMDFRKMEYNELKLFLGEGDIIEFIKEVAASFTDVAHQKQIQYVFESDTDSYITSFDHDKMERILFNLLSNAFKFTPFGGKIAVILNIVNPAVFTGEQKNLEIKIMDTGIGIPKESQEKIFERFYQNEMPESLQNQGSGIGLSIVKEFVKMHNGSIRLESEPNQGTCFIINIPVGEPSENQLPEPLPKLKLPPVSKKKNEGLAKKPVVLLVEDNDDLRFYLKDNLKQSFQVIEASNGKDGWQRALALHPKLIISDVNMPEMTGLELCKKIKEDSRTTQIPVILLTALSADKEQLEGLECGANDYIVKPFNFEILLSKMQNLLQMQQTLKNTYQKQLEIKASEVAVASEDEKFLKTALDYIELNITNSNFSVEELAKHLNLSRVSLYKKLLAVTGKTPVDCIRNIRLKRAIQLLEKSKLSIANIGFEVGFNNAAYFAKVFKEEFGILPSDYATKFRSKEKADEIVL
jgi:signal transduction histidine kinase/ligand-binding sensor domain-containing protein/DNA-binding response OmpR family regulator